MLLGATALGAWILGFALLLLVPVQRRWKDDGDCRGIVWHTVREPTNKERFAKWKGHFYYLAEPFEDRIALPESVFLKGTSYE